MAAAVVVLLREGELRVEEALKMLGIREVEEEAVVENGWMSGWGF